MNMLTKRRAGFGEITPYSPLERNLRSLLATFPGFADFSVFESGIEIETTDEAVILQMAAPGHSKDDFTIELTGDFATIKVTAKNCDECRQKHYICRERTTREFAESVKLPVEVIPAEAAATYENGVLRITVPREKRVPEEKSTIKIVSE